MARSSGIERFWMMDDDINGFYVSDGGKTRKIQAKSAIVAAEKLLIGIDRLAIGALEYQQFSWPAKSDLALCSYCDVCVLIDPAITAPCIYREELSMKEDRDFVMQALASGHVSARCRKISFPCPTNGTNFGGLSEVYARDGEEKAACERMVMAWGSEVCQIQRKRSGRIDLKINWKSINPLKSIYYR